MVRQPSSRDKQIIRLRDRGMTLEAIAVQFGLTKERGRQILSGYAGARRFTTVPDLMARFEVKRYEVDRTIKLAGLATSHAKDGDTFCPRRT